MMRTVINTTSAGCEWATDTRKPKGRDSVLRAVYVAALDCGHFVRTYTDFPKKLNCKICQREKEEHHE